MIKEIRDEFKLFEKTSKERSLIRADFSFLGIKIAQIIWHKGFDLSYPDTDFRCAVDGFLTSHIQTMMNHYLAFEYFAEESSSCSYEKSRIKRFKERIVEIFCYDITDGDTIEMIVGLGFKNKGVA